MLFIFYHGGGEKGIRTLDTTFWSYAPLAGEYLQPLGHLSATVCAHYQAFSYPCQAFESKFFHMLHLHV